MSNVLARTFNGATVQQRESDGYFNATAMCQANKKLWADFWRLSSTKSFTAELSSVMGIPITELAQVVQGGSPGLQGTWVHPHLAIHLAQWLSPKFAVLVTGWVQELLTKGAVAINEEEFDEIELIIRQATQLQAIRKAQRETERKLAAVEVRVDQAQRVATAALDQGQSRHGYHTVLGYWRVRGRSLTEKEAGSIGKEVAKLCRDRGCAIGQQNSERWGTVNSYPDEILEEVYNARYGSKKAIPAASHT